MLPEDLHTVHSPVPSEEGGRGCVVSNMQCANLMTRDVHVVQCTQNTWWTLSEVTLTGQRIPANCTCIQLPQ